MQQGKQQQPQKFRITLYSEGGRPFYATTNEAIRRFSAKGPLANRVLLRPGDARPMLPGEIRRVLIEKKFGEASVSEKEARLLDYSRPLASCVVAGYSLDRDVEGFVEFKREGQDRRMEIPKAVLPKGMVLLMTEFEVEGSEHMTIRLTQNAVAHTYMLPQHGVSVVTKCCLMHPIGFSTTKSQGGVSFSLIDFGLDLGGPREWVGTFVFGQKPGCYGRYLNADLSHYELIGDKRGRRLAIPIVEMVG